MAIGMRSTVLLWLAIAVVASRDRFAFAVSETDDPVAINPGPPTILLGDVWLSPQGDDSKAGTRESPLRSLQTAIDRVSAGRTVWLLPGEYVFTETVKIPKHKRGTAGEPFRISGLAGGPKPMLNFTGVDRSGEIRGLQVDGAFWHLHYLEVFGASDNNVNVAGSHNLLERLDVHDANDTGLQINSSSSLMPAHNRVLNCDSYLNADRSAEDADGFAAKLGIGPGNSFDGCRAWHNCDDNWDLYDARNVVKLKDCWALEARHPDKSKSNSDGNGFKLGGLRSENSGWNKRSLFTSYADYVKANSSPHQLDRCFAIGNPAWGFHRNNNPSTEVSCLDCGGWSNGRGDFSEGLAVGGERVSLTNVTPAAAIAAERDARGYLPSIHDVR